MWPFKKSVPENPSDKFYAVGDKVADDFCFAIRLEGGPGVALGKDGVICWVGGYGEIRDLLLPLLLAKKQ